MGLKVFLTGAFGNVGQWVLTELLTQGHEVMAFELRNERTEKKQIKLSKNLDFDTIWGDLTNEEQVKSLITERQPDVIIHVAAVIAPTAYIIPEIAYKVNVRGTKYLIEAAQTVNQLQRFVFISSYSVHGSKNPHKDYSPLTGNSPVKPGDNYGKHKIEGEKMLEASNLDWTVIRLPAVFSVDPEFGRSAEFSRFAFLLDPNRDQSAIDVRDAGLAIANAAISDTKGRKFDICGDPSKGWTGKARDLSGKIIEANGLRRFPDECYRHADPEVDESWYYEGTVDPTEAQEILQFQRYSIDEYLNYIKKQAGFSRYIIKLLSPIVSRLAARQSKFYGKPIKYDSREMWEVIKQEFEIDESKLTMF